VAVAALAMKTKGILKKDTSSPANSTSAGPAKASKSRSQKTLAKTQPLASGDADEEDEMEGADDSDNDDGVNDLDESYTRL